MTTASQPAFVVTIEQPPDSGFVAVRVRTQCADLAELVTGTGRRLKPEHVLVRQTDFARDPARYHAHRRRLTVLAEPSSTNRLLDLVAPLRRLGAVHAFDPTAAGDGTPAITAASLGVPVSLRMSADWPEEVVRAMLDYFLHSATLTTPVEPFFAISRAVSRPRDSVWKDIFACAPGHAFYIDREARVSLSWLWAQRGEFFGTIDDDLRTFGNSPLWNRLMEPDETTFVSQTDCAFCAHYPCCRAGLRMIDPTGEACALWRGVMDSIAETYRSHSSEIAPAEESASCPTRC